MCDNPNKKPKNETPPLNLNGEHPFPPSDDDLRERQRLIQQLQTIGVLLGRSSVDAPPQYGGGAAQVSSWLEANTVPPTDAFLSLLKLGRPIAVIWSRYDEEGSITTTSSSVVKKTAVRFVETRLLRTLAKDIDSLVHNQNTKREPSTNATKLEDAFPSTLVKGSSTLRAFKASLQDTFPELDASKLSHVRFGSFDTEGQGEENTPFIISSIALVFQDGTLFVGSFYTETITIAQIAKFLQDFIGIAPDGFTWYSFGGREQELLHTTDIQGETAAHFGLNNIGLCNALALTREVPTSELVKSQAGLDFWIRFNRTPKETAYLVLVGAETIPDRDDEAGMISYLNKPVREVCIRMCEADALAILEICQRIIKH